ncbi:hypothetical protein I302_108905 [Kwoniella bestiolae CBS 10118]|uniref:DHHA2 domain-containing protein n=1 Tax=Kwoniella bestiolae CBS 10118 TaxID=1296100 RepID=A0A1B9FUE9_9TREE|nr:hypothetical protein I302_08043 [Kwoniella bestiolae CBS 10118]OCF22395.1 hypothetical protein I302_08043 [Kwoniella bestiolae CBS 10118]
MRIPRNSKLFCLLISLSFIPPLLIFVGLLAYLNESMRICLPFSIERLSSTAHRKLSCQPPSTFNTRPYSTKLEGIMLEAEGNQADGVAGGQEGRLAGFLRSQKETFLDDLQKGKGKGWTVVMGNEAGDLDSIASSISYSYLSSTLSAKRSIPLILTPQRLMTLRPENLLALKLSSVPLDSLLHSEQLPIPTNSLSSQGVKFGLVDHNKLLPLFIPSSEHTNTTTQSPGKLDSQGESDAVESIIDHHDDEHSHPNAEVREITVPTGSCASLVTKHFEPQWKSSISGPAGARGGPVPPELATLLLSSILIDTSGLKPGRKATPVDFASAQFLYTLSTLYTPSNDTPTNGNGDGDVVEFSQDGSNIPSDLTALNEELQNTKSDVSSLTTPELLLRDYKEYLLPTSSDSYATLKVGLSTVPMGLKTWLTKEPSGFESFLGEVEGYMVEKQLDIEGVLTTFSNSQGKHRRELALVVRTGGAIKSEVQAKRVLDELKVGLEGSGEVLDLKKWDKDDKGAKVSLWEKYADRTVVWKQGNGKSTRKQVAPLLVSVVFPV